MNDLVVALCKGVQHTLSSSAQGSVFPRAQCDVRGHAPGASVSGSEAYIPRMGKELTDKLYPTDGDRDSLRGLALPSLPLRNWLCVRGVDLATYCPL